MLFHSLVRAVLVTVLVTTDFFSFGQCGTVQDPPHHPLAPATPIMQRGGGPLIIPVIVHVYYTEVILPVVTERIMESIDSCNAYLRATNPEIPLVHPAFAALVADVGVELRLATIDENGNCISGILYHLYDPADGSATIAHQQNTNRYLNIHVIPSSNSYATLPAPPQPDPGIPGDGILFSTYDAQFRLLSLPHEVGHYLGLYHTFGLSNQSGVTCGDDFIADTPVTKGSSTDGCDQELSECTAGVIENVDNHMDYSTCRKMFTTGQAAHMAAVLDDGTLNRFSLHQASNLDATGVFLTPTCPIDAFIWQRSFQGCDSSRAEFFACVEGRLPETVQWYFPGGSPASSTESRVDVYYPDMGPHTAQLIVCAGGSCDTVNHSFTINVGNALSNGLPLVTASPFTEDFEDDFTFPQTHMAPVNDGTSTWAPCDFAGYASGNCLYVAAETLAASDTCDLVLGNFDFAGLTQPTISFYVAATSHTFSPWFVLELRFRDLCSNIFQGNPWGSWQLNEMCSSNSATGFVPTADEQWTPISLTRPEWSQASRAELVLRLRRPATGGGLPEAFYLDDINVGEAPVGLAGMADAPPLWVLPNPAQDLITIQVDAPDARSSLLVQDVSGREILRRAGINGSTQLDVSAWSRGSYVITLLSGAAPKRTTLIVR